MLNEADRKFFRPKWRRVVATLFCAGWTVVEWFSGEPFWGVMAAGITLYCLWHFFYAYEESQDTPE
ncbi:hypothetical protein HGG82_05765 [Marinomonas sp. M1K-6]|uniref:DUF3329 domain-containing protein n=1 Tax=Marinomonas profundi TaxID=2726122 RepID=A0A847RA73_9GAMM|nr:hypothetical protein [Marinomonas profundi]NLQ17130.1 hypothetical protein [Marinomonas profundi]UDV04848.1 hypothetical protein J8N69_08005 [Marinomonas profundi]